MLRDLRHNNATWLEDGGRDGQRGSRMGIAYWHTTPDMQAQENRRSPGMMSSWPRTRGARLGFPTATRLLGDRADA